MVVRPQQKESLWIIKLSRKAILLFGLFTLSTQRVYPFYTYYVKPHA